MGNSIKEVFKGYSKYSEEEFLDIWSNGTIVVDTNILLNLYRYSEDTRNEIINVLREIKDRLWIPYYVGEEYFKNRDNVIVQMDNEYDVLLGQVEKCFDKLRNDISQKNSNRFSCKDELIKVLDTNKKDIFKIIEKEKKKQKDFAEEDNIENIIFELFNDSMGEKINESEFEKVYLEGKRRIKDSIPPGFKDSQKEENGDYYIFYSMMKFAKENNKHIIFIIDDVKEDWYYIVHGENKGGEYRLLNEFYKETGKLLLLYPTIKFLYKYNEILGEKNKKINKEVKEELMSNYKFENRFDITIFQLENVLNSWYRHSFGKDEELEMLSLILTRLSNITGISTLKEYILMLKYAIENDDRITARLYRVRIKAMLKRLEERGDILKFSDSNNMYIDTLVKDIRRITNIINNNINKDGYTVRRLLDELYEYAYSYTTINNEKELKKIKEKCDTLLKSINKELNKV